MNAATGTNKPPLSLGFGEYSAATVLTIFDTPDTTPRTKIFTSARILLKMVVVANAPQVLVSCLYFAYNAIYTSMLQASEVAGFTTTRKALRTTNPQGAQRSSYWLSLPFSYALPLAGASSLLHWLISRALFLARTEVIDSWSADVEDVSFIEVAYSPLAILLSMLWGIVLLLAMLANGLRKLPPNAILIGGNSLALAAACQNANSAGHERRPVMWGVQKEMEIHEGAGDVDDEAAREEYLHCCFSADEVEPLSAGRKYI